MEIHLLEIEMEAVGSVEGFEKAAKRFARNEWERRPPRTLISLHLFICNHNNCPARFELQE